jgi:subtilisin family serine protease
MIFRKRKDVSLLPHTRTEVYGFNPNAAQVFGWEILKLGVNANWAKSEGEDVIVSVIDTGCDLNHKDIRNNLLPGKNFISKGSDPNDDNGHGSHVCGTIAAENNGLGMVGVAPKTKIMPVKALDKNGQGNLKDIIDAIYWSADNKADFITMSLGAPTDSRSLKQAIDYANVKGSVVFAAAGNSGKEVEIMYPARYNNTLAIGAIDENFHRTSFTCSGNDLDFLAPGHNIFSLAPKNGYAIMSGTSMSNPYAVGCACLLLSYDKKYKTFNFNRNYRRYISVMSEMTISISQEQYKSKRYQGYGIIKIKI